MSINEFVNEANKGRLRHKNTHYTINSEVEGLKVSVTCFNTDSISVSIDGEEIVKAGPQSVLEWKSTIVEAINYFLD